MDRKPNPGAPKASDPADAFGVAMGDMWRAMTGTTQLPPANVPLTTLAELDPA
jgi:hypothetical protein